jgi:hypothetical protein
VSFRALAIAPAVLVLAVFTALGIAGGPHGALRVEIEAVKLLALAGCLAAATSFADSDYLRRAWQLAAASLAFLLVRDACMLGGLTTQGQQGDLLIGLFVLCSNVAGVASAWLMAHTFQVAGLATAESVPRWRSLTVLAFVVALVICSPSLVISVQGLARGELRYLVWLFSGLGDVLSLALIAPIMLTAIAMRGGALIWPWALLTAGMAGWVLYDVAGLLEPLLGPLPSRLVEEALRALACLYTAAAGLAQRKIVREGAD